MKDILLVMCTVLGTVYAQMVFKWQAASLKLGTLRSPGDFLALLAQMFRPWILTAFLAQFLGAVCWMVAVKNMPLTRAYMFIMLTFVLVMACGALIFREPLSNMRIIGCCFIILGLIIGGGR